MGRYANYDDVQDRLFGTTKQNFGDEQKDLVNSMIDQVHWLFVRYLDGHEPPKDAALVLLEVDEVIRRLQWIDNKESEPPMGLHDKTEKMLDKYKQTESSSAAVVTGSVYRRYGGSRF